MEKPTDEMINFYEQRTREHINRVIKSVGMLSKSYAGVHPVDFDKLAIDVKIHDESKFSPEEYIPYVWLSWMYKQKQEGKPFQYPDGIEEDVKIATKSHVETNKHHVQAWSDPKQMDNESIAHMVADWHGMSLELASDDPLKNTLEWSESMFKRHSFSKEQKELILDLIESLDHANVPKAKIVLNALGVV